MTEKRYIAFYSNTFQKEFQKLSGVHRKMVMKKIAMMEDDPFYPSLRTKKMEGNSGYYESSVNMDIRFFWYFRDDRVITLTDIGHHDVLRKY